MEFNIRQAHHSDLPYIYDICLKTGLGGSDASASVSDPFMVGQYFAAPYLHFEIDCCFVLTGNAIPVGYIIGASSTKKFNDWMNKKWLPAIRNYYPTDRKAKSDFEQFLIDIINRDCGFPDFLNHYPSQLHIDLMPIAQKKGYGKKLMTAFINKLKDKGSPGLHLGVGAKNTNAIAFYKNIGFRELKKEPGAIFMGLGLAAAL